MIFSIQRLIEHFGLPLNRTKLIRHDRRFVGFWRQGSEIFHHEASWQSATRGPYGSASFVVQFIPSPRLADGDQSAMLVGAHEILASRQCRDPEELFALKAEHARNRPSIGQQVYDLRVLEEFEELAERILVRWGKASSTRSWHQWADRRIKEIVEVRQSSAEPGFPGFSRFQSSIDDVLLFPHAWRAALASVGGVYLLVCPDTGQQYVGSAYGDQGFYGRWLSYADNGHGGNVLLRNRKRSNFSISILEVASPDMAARDIISRESAWKEKLGTRAHGLNLN